MSIKHWHVLLSFRPPASSLFHCKFANEPLYYRIYESSSWNLCMQLFSQIVFGLLAFSVVFFFFGCNGDLSTHTLTSWATAWDLPACNLSSIRLLSKACVWSCVWIFMNYRFVGFSMNPLYYSIFTILQKYQLGVNFVMCNIITFLSGNLTTLCFHVLTKGINDGVIAQKWSWSDRISEKNKFRMVGSLESKARKIQRFKR